MDMGMGCLVGVKMIVFLALRMEMNMAVRLVLYGSVYPPDKISEAKADKQPGCCSPSKRFHSF